MCSSFILRFINSHLSLSLCVCFCYLFPLFFSPRSTLQLYCVKRTKPKIDLHQNVKKLCRHCLNKMNIGPQCKIYYHFVNMSRHKSNIRIIKMENRKIYVGMYVCKCENIRQNAVCDSKRKFAIIQI